MKGTGKILVIIGIQLEYLIFLTIVFSSRETSPQRLQMAISLYSTDLSAIVLLTDAKCSISSGVTRGQ